MKRFLAFAITLLFIVQVLTGMEIHRDNEHTDKITTLDVMPTEANEPSPRPTTRKNQNESHDFGSSWFDDLDDGSGLSDRSGVLVSGGKVWMDSWMYTREITVTNSGDALTGYQLELNLTPQNFNYARADENGDDIRFRDVNGKMLDYWLEEWNTSGASKIWVNVTNIPNGNSEILMYYGNPYAAPASNGGATFEFFDDFEGTSVDQTKWNVGSGDIAVDDGYLNIYWRGY